MRVLICEGLEGCFFPETRYVVQPGEAGKPASVYFAEGAPTGVVLHESAGEGYVIVESIDRLSLVERDNGKRYVKNGRWFVEGVFQRSDVKNANGRTYSRKLWERLINDKKSPALETLNARGMAGMFEHPADGRTKGPEVALLVDRLSLHEDGVVKGRAELLDTPVGLILQELTAKNVRWGVSSRGSGTIDEKGNVSESDYMVETWDAVMRPSTPGAYPKLVSGDQDGKRGVAEGADGDGEGDDKLPGDHADEASVARLQEALRAVLEGETSEADVARTVIRLIVESKEVIARPNAGGALDSLVDVVRKAERVMVEATLAAKEPIREDRTSTNPTSVVRHLAESLKREKSEVKTIAAERDELSQRLTEAEARCSKLDAMLTVTKAALVNATRREAHGDTREDVIQEAIDSVPELKSYRNVLESVDATKLDEVIGTLTARIIENRAAPVVPVRVQSTLPCRGVAGGVVKPVQQTTRTAIHEAVALAAAASRRATIAD
jgi:hypothetical protein